MWAYQLLQILLLVLGRYLMAFGKENSFQKALCLKLHVRVTLRREYIFLCRLERIDRSCLECIVLSYLERIGLNCRQCIVLSRRGCRLHCCRGRIDLRFGHYRNEALLLSTRTRETLETS